MAMAMDPPTATGETTNGGVHHLGQQRSRRRCRQRRRATRRPGRERLPRPGTVDRIAPGGAPSALRRPISRVRSVTDTSMMFMTPIPPTSSDSAAMPVSRMVSVLDTDVAVSSSASWLAMVKSAVPSARDGVQLLEQRVGLLVGRGQLVAGGRLQVDGRHRLAVRPADQPVGRRCANGTTAWSSRLLVASEPAEASTPTTVRSMLLIVTIWPTTSVVPNSSVAVSARGRRRPRSRRRRRR